MASPTPPDSGNRNDRLNGWKEIALHFGKGVRTVQRWEKDLGLPVRRLGTGRGEIVFAFTSELEAWREAAERGGNLASKPGEEDGQEQPDQPAGERAEAESPIVPLPADALPGHSPSGTIAPGRDPLPRGFPRQFLLPLLVLLAVLGGALAWWVLARPSSEPYEARVEHHALRVYDENGGLVWQHRFAFPLADSTDPGFEPKAMPRVWVEDLDGDGHREVLFATLNEETREGGLFCFDHAGKLRFRHAVQREVVYGGLPYAGPWHPIALLVAADPAGRKAAWVAFQDRDQFPTVLEKVGPGGELLGTFWHAGTIECLVPAEFEHRPVILAGANNNEFSGAALAVVDREHPTGRSPAIDRKFLCTTCPPAPPTAYLVFPGTEIERVQHASAAVRLIRPGEQGQFSMSVMHLFVPGFFGREGQPSKGYTTYVFSPDLVPLVAHHEPSYRLIHDEAYKLGILDHRFSEAEDQALKVLRWNGSAFENMPLPPRH